MIIYIFLLFIFLIAIFLFLYDTFFIKNQNLKLKRRTNKANYCILIPARNESRVIENLILSIKNQNINVNMSDVYIIVESKNDKTVSIAEKYGVSCFVRKKLNLKTKGYALMKIFDYFFENNKLYDIYFIMDADNILDEHFIENMLISYHDGYDIVTGYRKSTNTNYNRITITSSLTFLLINTLLNESKLKKNRPITISGTGYFITNNLVNKWHTFPFHSLTEDYELSVYASINNYKTSYNKKAIFYDEQPIVFKESVKQRTRWIKGYFQVRKKYLKYLSHNLDNKTILGEYIGIKPYLLMLLSVISFYIVELFLVIYNLINNNDFVIHIYIILITTLIIYIFLQIVTFVCIKKDNNNLELSNKSKIIAILYNPIFLLSYVLCLIKTFKKNITWQEIKHIGNQKD